MKKVFALLLVLMLVFSAVPVLAESSDDGAEGTQFEKILLKKGSLILKDFKKCYELQDKADKYYPLKFECACLTDIETGETVYALRAEYRYYSSAISDYKYLTGVMDPDEIEGAITTLQYIKEHISELTDYSEIVYTSNSGMKIGAFYESGGNQIFINLSGTSIAYDVGDLDNMIEAFSKVKEAIPN